MPADAYNPVYMVPVVSNGVNYWSILFCGVLSMVIGAIWYGPLFGKKWAKIIGATNQDLETRKKMQKEAGPLYLIQFLLSLFQIFELSTFINWMYKIDPTRVFDIGYIFIALSLWAAFIVPTIAGSAMWNNDSSKIKWARFLIQSGYQLVNFIVFGLVLGMWR